MLAPAVIRAQAPSISKSFPCRSNTSFTCCKTTPHGLHLVNLTSQHETFVSVNSYHYLGRTRLTSNSDSHSAVNMADSNHTVEAQLKELINQMSYQGMGKAIQQLEAAKEHMKRREEKGLTLMTLPAELRLQIISNCVRDQFTAWLNDGRHFTPGFSPWPRASLKSTCHQLRADYLVAHRDFVSVEASIDGRWRSVRSDMLETAGALVYCRTRNLDVENAKDVAEDWAKRDSCKRTYGVISLPQHGTRTYVCNWRYLLGASRRTSCAALLEA